MNPKAYIETTIISYLAGRPSRDIIVAAHQQITHEWWSKRKEGFDLFRPPSLFGTRPRREIGE